MKLSFVCKSISSIVIYFYIVVLKSLKNFIINFIDSFISNFNILEYLWIQIDSFALKYLFNMFIEIKITIT